MNKLKIAVVGVGYLGKFHAEKYQQIPTVELTHVVDINEQRVQEVAQQLKIKCSTDYKSLVGQVDAVSIVVPTQLHYTVAKFFLENGIHVLLEKPMTTDLNHAQELIQLSSEKKLILQVGHLERFNAALQALSGILNEPRFIESHRIAPFNLRGSDVNVILDLMIHDIDLIQSMVNSPIKSIDANGASVLSDKIDIANARINFVNGCVANVTASRVSAKSERKMRIFQHDAYFSLDLQNRKVSIYRKGNGELFPGIPNIDMQEKSFEQNDALFEEVQAFIFAILNKHKPLVCGEEGKRSLEIAMQISELIQRGGA